MERSIDIPTLKERYELMIKARNFHYENFNKWMTYFYVAIAALFVGLCTLVSSANQNIENKNLLEYLSILLGLFVSLFWYWSCKGYYYWNVHFIMMVQYYEEHLLKLPVAERVYNVFANKKIQNNYASPITGANISTSKVAILFSFIIACVWGFIFAYLLLRSFYTNYPSTPYFLLIFCSATISVLAVIGVSYVIPKRYLYSQHDHIPDLKIEQKNNLA